MANRIIPVLLLLVAAALASDGRPAQSATFPELGLLQTGAPLPDFAGVDVSEPGLELIGLEDLLGWVKSAGKDSHAVVVFFRTSCIPCRVGLFELRDHASELEKAHIQVLLVALGDDRAMVREFLKQNKLPFHTLHDPDGKMAMRYGVMGKTGDLSQARIPVTVLVSAAGKVSGFIMAEGEDYLSLVLKGHL